MLWVVVQKFLEQLLRKVAMRHPPRAASPEPCFQEPAAMNCRPRAELNCRERVAVEKFLYPWAARNRKPQTGYQASPERLRVGARRTGALPQPGLRAQPEVNLQLQAEECYQGVMEEPQNPSGARKRKQ